MDQIRGVIKNLKRYKQLLSFEGLKFERNITPTDLDAIIDFASKEWVLIEYKTEGNPVLRGQRIAISSLLEHQAKSGIKALGIIATHNYPSHEIIDGAQCLVIEVWTQRKGWQQPRQQRTVRETIDFWRDWIGAK